MILNEFEYSRKWYEQVYHGNLCSWMDKVREPDDLLKLYEMPPFPYFYHRFRAWLRPLKLANGSQILETGFNSGKTSYWLAQYFDDVDISIDAIDFSTELKHVAQSLPKLHRNIRQCLFADCSKLPFKSSAYDLITCLDVIEHLPEQTYLGMLSEFQRVIKPYGLIMCYTGKAPQIEHIHVIDNSKLITDIARFGFLPLHETGKNQMILFIKNGKGRMP